MMQPVSHIFPELTIPKRIVITMHQKPDGDAMGSTLGLFHFLQTFGHHVQVISPTNWAKFLDWMPGCDSVMDYENEMAKSNTMIAEAEWIFCLDFNTLNRTKKMETALATSNAVRILIDHHEQPQTEVFSYGVSDTTKSSTCEMVYDFIKASGYQDLINDSVAQCLYTGLMTDTGSFRFPSTSADVHLMVADLKQRGLQHSVIHEHLYDQFSENRLRFIGNTLLNRMEVFFEYNTALIAIPQADLIKYDIKTGDTEGLVNYPLNIAGIKFATLITERTDEVKLSFRSKGDFNVSSFAKNYFDGGGHFNASGGRTKTSFIDTIAYFKKILSDIHPQ